MSIVFRNNITSKLKNTTSELATILILDRWAQAKNHLAHHKPFYRKKAILLILHS